MVTTKKEHTLKEKKKKLFFQLQQIIECLLKKKFQAVP